MRTSDFVGRWKILDAELVLRADCTWALKRGIQRVPWFNMFEEDEGRWMYARHNLGFAKMGGGSGFRVRILRMNKRAIFIPESDGDTIEILRLPSS